MAYYWDFEDYSDEPCVEYIDGVFYITMYHGTTIKNVQTIWNKGFRPSTRGYLGHGVYFSTNIEKAKQHPFGCPDWNRAIVKVRVDVGRVFVARNRHNRCRTTWHDYGFDTAWAPPGNTLLKSGYPMNCVWDPDRIEVLYIIYPKRRIYDAWSYN